MLFEIEEKYIVVRENFSGGPAVGLSGLVNLPKEDVVSRDELVRALLNGMDFPLGSKVQDDVYYDTLGKKILLRTRHEYSGDFLKSVKITVKEKIEGGREETEVRQDVSGEDPEYKGNSGDFYADLKALSKKVGISGVEDFNSLYDGIRNYLDPKCRVKKEMIYGEDDKVFYDFSVVDFPGGLVLPLFEAESKYQNAGDVEAAVAKISSALKKQSLRLVRVAGCSNEEIALAAGNLHQ
jgi:hypothetical protein